MNRSRFLLLLALILTASVGAWLSRGGLLAQEKPAPSVLGLPLTGAQAGHAVKQPGPGRFQYIFVSSLDQVGLFDTATGKLYYPSKVPDRRWKLGLDVPADLPAEAARNPQSHRFHYQPGIALVDTTTGKTYKVVDNKGGKAPYKWSPDLPAVTE